MASPRPVEQTDLFKFKFIQAGNLSPDGKQAAYVVAHVDAEEEKQYSAIWLVALETGESRQLTGGTAIDYDPQWSPDGKKIAFISTRKEKPQIFVIPIDGGEARQLTTLKQGVGGGPVWSPDGKAIAFTATKAEETRDPAKPYRVARHVYRFNGLGNVDDVAQTLFVIAASGGEPRQVTNDDYSSGSPQWSPDGKSLLYLVSMMPDVHDTFLARLRVVDLVSGAVRDVLGDWGTAGAAAWLPDGQHIAFEGVPFGLKIGSKADLWIISADGNGKPECRTASLRVGVGGGLEPDMPVLLFLTTVPISTDGQTAYVGVQEGGNIGIYRVALSGAESFAPIVKGDRAAMLVDVDDRHVLYVVSDFNLPTDLYVCDATGEHEKRLTNINEELLAQLTPPHIEHLQFPGSDGVNVEGWLWTPHNGIAHYPTILLIHGGPHSAWGHVFNFNAQMLCGAGYAVLMVNHRASIGYGDEFSTAIKGDWGNLDYKDLMAGVDHVIAKGLADANRLGICGLSGGGNLTCWTVGQTTRFKAAVPENPVTNWQSFYGVSDIGVWFAVEQMGGHPHEIPDVYAKSSPITYAHRCKTPTLLVQGEHDWRCPPEQSEQFYTVLKANGCTAEMLRLPNAPHGGSLIGEPIVRRAHNEALLGWMNRYVLGKTE